MQIIQTNIASHQLKLTTTSQIQDPVRAEAGKQQVFNLFQSWAKERVGDLEDTNLDDIDKAADPLAYLMKHASNLRDLGTALKDGGELLRKTAAWVPLPKYVLALRYTLLKLNRQGASQRKD